MKKFILIIVLLLASSAFICGETAADILFLMKTPSASAVIVGNAPVYDTRDGKILYFLPEGVIVCVYEDYSGEWYYISELLSHDPGWVKKENLNIFNAPCKKEPVNRSQLERYMNITGIGSETDYLIFTDLSRNFTHVFRGKKGNWHLIKSMLCSTGKYDSPTVRGVFKITERGEWFFSERLGSGGKFWLRIKGSYLFHSQAMDAEMNILPENNGLGEHITNGCIRLSTEDAEWLYRNIPDNTTVFI